jgi:hypothetical protein|tara:strand:+ start:22924 stop:23244 length:321 start_codon:yes stop_codon:yes gene_type:complete
VSNPITFQPTEFHDVRTGEKSFGCRVYDNYDTCYTNNWTSIPDDDLEVIAQCIEFLINESPFDIMPTSFETMCDYIREHECGVMVGDEWYDWEQIKHLFVKEQNNA